MNEIFLEDCPFCDSPLVSFQQLPDGLCVACTECGGRTRSVSRQEYPASRWTELAIDVMVKLKAVTLWNRKPENKLQAERRVGLLKTIALLRGDQNTLLLVEHFEGILRRRAEQQKNGKPSDFAHPLP